jgi:quinol monooxygenase YgiN
MARMSRIVVMGQLDLHPEDAAAAAELMRVMMEATIHEQGCHHYAYSRDLSVSHRFQLSELWEDEAALAAHLGASHTATYRAAMRQLRVQSRTVRKYEVSNIQDL